LSEAPSRLLLVGLPGAGKSTVGRCAAEALGWDFLDADAEVERASGRTVAEIFAELGEPAFRQREAAVVEEALRRDALVIAPGAGWIEGVQELAALPPRTLVLHLRITAVEAAERLVGDAGERPLLKAADPRAALRRLEERRLPLYRKAHVELSGSGDPAAVCARVVALLSQLSKGVRD
jgi:shikimate kinase